MVRRRVSRCRLFCRAGQAELHACLLARTTKPLFVRIFEATKVA